MEKVKFILILRVNVSKYVLSRFLVVGISDCGFKESGELIDFLPLFL